MNSHRLSYQSQVFGESSTIGRLIENFPAIRHALFVEGVPKGFIGRRYTADSRLTSLETEGHSRVLRFGSSGLTGVVGIELSSGHVVEIVKPQHPVSLFVNTSIVQFTETVKAVINRFPYYDSDSDEEEIGSVAHELMEIIGRIDPEAVVPDRYWSTFIDDIEIGDLSTEAILAVIDRG